MTDKICIKSLLPAELESLLEQYNQPKYRAGQVFKWLSTGVSEFSQMSDVPKVLREILEENTFISSVEIVKKQSSEIDGTIKYLYELFDGTCVETVLMKYEHGNSVCLSTQAGCKMGCAFCASFDKGKTRNLTPAEIYDQVLKTAEDSGEKISNIVLMGTGEPLDNYDNVLSFLRIISHPNGVNIGMRHISLSTCGIVPKIKQLAQLKLQLTLSISLHAPIDTIRSKIMPINNKYNVNQLINACREYAKVTGRRISFEYAMIKGMTDTQECAKELVHKLAGLGAHVNLIPLNNIDGSTLVPSDKKTIQEFQNYLLKHKVNTTVRRSLGADISAACGQLRKQEMNKEGTQS